MEDVLSNRGAEYGSVLSGRTKVNTCIDARVLHFFERIRKASERACDANEQIGLHLKMRVRTEFVRENADCCATHA